ncbi:bifunctional demethylmenaquinone methyltransferase/2-methoxy-6-polyprenyl-1,4-benzoquinol methylase UbiE [Granulicella cerasi]|uniref:bifunctional demethylmenaquinone methyltransferase/2-methoxy-6-polyprenyl-1,4-benzoquinol methylase UbiE n=1 Tax=Granulicella cerasi TaxID=741063 RepID=UPI0021DFF3CB|nr:bifunctional demethylmenaquinone methyltransferase/2-methoxy-6-polyprenyl-1,4-benzoquinol methylase UbiE [Granulicella cerasi]
MPTETTGARTANERTQAEAAQNVQAMFNSIAPKYDLLNHLISMGLDRRWWRKTARAFTPVLKNPDARILDICCGTGDQTSALLAARPANAARLTGLDFSAQMLDRARCKYATEPIDWIEGDAMHLPFPDNSFDLVTSAFGFRNLTDYAAGLREIARVLKPGGRIGVLEANQPEGAKALAYNLYFSQIAPLIGGMISGDRAAYKYLPDSVRRFPRPPKMLALMAEAGFVDAHWDGYLLHSAGLYRGTKA